MTQDAWVISEEELSKRMMLFVQDDSPKRSRGVRIFLWVFVSIAVALNLWFDYYHPPGFLIDIIILIYICVKWDRRNSN